MKFLRVDMSSRKVEFQDIPVKYKELGGRALIAKILLEEVYPLCHPLGKNNKLIFTAGLTGGSVIPCSGRISVGAKSPLTWGIKESNSGGNTGTRIAKHGIEAIIVEKKPKDNELYILELLDDNPKLVPANNLKGKGNYETVRIIQETYGKDIACITIGPAGEMLLPAACINNTDVNYVPSRVNGRGGMGAVMGSKGLKAIVIKDFGQLKQPKDKEGFKIALKNFVDGILNAPSTKNYHNFGTPVFVDPVNALGCLPTRNFGTGKFEDAEKINGDTFINTITNRKGNPIGHACTPGCIIRCSHTYPDKGGKTIVSPLEYETISLMGSNCYINNLDSIAELNYICNDLGLDTIETGGALAVAMEAGVLPFGDVEKSKAILSGLYHGEPLSRIIASGVVTTAKVFGVYHAPAVKGQGMAGYEPRGLKGLGVTYATSPQGADHTAGHTMSAKLDHHKPEGQAAASKKSQRLTTIFDVLGFCSFVGPALRETPEIISEVVNRFFDWNLSLEEFLNIGTNTLKMELEFNRKAGFNKFHDRLPEYFYEEINLATGTVFDVSDDDLDSVAQL